MTHSTITSMALAEELIAIEADRLSDEDIAQLKRLILDYAAVTLCGSAQPWGRKLRTWAGEHGAPGQAHLFGSGDGANAATAGLVNGTAAHGYELDDTHQGSSSHPGAVVITAALAVAEETGASGGALLAAITAGYEAMARIGMASISTEGGDHGFHATCLFGPFGAAAAAAKLLRLDATGMAGAWGLALSMTGGSAQFAFEPEGTMVKRLHAGLPAHHGIIAAQLARLGVTAPIQSLEGTFGFYNLYSTHPKLERLQKQAGEPWQIHQVSFKPYSCCRKFHTLIDGLAVATDNFKIPTETIERIDVYAPQNAITKHMMRRPDSVMAAQYSMPYIVGATLGFGPQRYDAYGTAHHDDPRLLSIIDKVEAHHDASFDALVPNQMPSRVAIRLHDGQQRQAEELEALGSPAKPLSFEGILAKARTLIAMTDPDINLDAIAAAVDALPSLTSAQRLTERFVAPNYDAAVQATTGTV